MPKYPTFLSPRQITDLHKVIRSGYATAQEFMDPIPLIQIRRLDDATGRYADHGPLFRPIQIGFGLRELRETGGAISETSSDGDMSYWANEMVLRVGDRFTWGGQVCEISAIYPEVFGVRQAEIKLLQ